MGHPLYPGLQSPPSLPTSSLPKCRPTQPLQEPRGHCRTSAATAQAPVVAGAVTAALSPSSARSIMLKFPSQS